MHVNPVIYNTFEEAVDCLNVPSDTFIVKLVASSESLDRVREDLRVVYKVGIGLMKSPGHPSGNQLYHRQFPIIASLQKYKSLPVLRVWPDGTTEYFGRYKYEELYPRLTPEGFKYYEFKLQRVWNSNHTHVKS